MTSVPLQIAELVAVTVTSGATVCVTLIVMAFDDAGEPVAQAAFDDNRTVITSLSSNEVLEKEDASEPTFIPFTCH